MATLPTPGIDPRLSQPVVLGDGVNILGTSANPLVTNNQGPPSAITLVKTSINLAASGDSAAIIAGIANQKIHIVHYKVQNTSAADTTVIYKDGGTAWNGLGFLLGSRVSDVFDAPGGVEEGEIILGAGNSFVINLSAANQLSGLVIWWQG